MIAFVTQNEAYLLESVLHAHQNDHKVSYDWITNHHPVNRNQLIIAAFQLRSRGILKGLKNPSEINRKITDWTIKPESEIEHFYHEKCDCTGCIDHRAGEEARQKWLKSPEGIEAKKRYEENKVRERLEQERLRAIEHAQRRVENLTNLDSIKRTLKDHKKRAERAGCWVGEVTPEQYLARCKEFEYKCAYCGGDWNVLEHIWPIDLKGAHTILNFAPACFSCNSRKTGLHPERFLNKYDVLPCGVKAIEVSIKLHSVICEETL